MQRRLVAILAADVVDYSTLVDKDEAGTIAALKSHRAKVFDPETAKHGGRIFKLMGDGTLVEFASVVDAVKCGLAIQKAMADADSPIRLRIGIHLGDVIDDGDDIYGDGVNVATRLEGLSEAGGLCISSVVRESLGNRIEAEFANGGERRIKGKSLPIHVWRWSRAAGSEFMASTDHLLSNRAVPEFDRPALAVLPLLNLSGDPEQEYFADGLTEDIITGLTHWRTFPVISRHSCFAYKQTNVNVIEAGHKLGARYILEGSVRKSADQVRISIQLVDSSTGQHIWAQRYDRDLTNIFEVQDDIVQCIVAQIAPEVMVAESKRSGSRSEADLGAWELCQRALPLVRRRTPESIAAGKKLFRRAAKLRPDYSDAHAGLAMSYNMEILAGVAKDRDSTAMLAMDAARKAIDCDEASSFAHHELSTAFQWRNRVADALAEARIAVDLNPYDASALHALGNKSDLAGDPAGIARMEKAQKLNPADAQLHSHLVFLARAYVNAGSFETGGDCARSALRRKPDYAPAHYILAIAMAHLGRLDEGRQALRKCDGISPGFVGSRRDWQPYVDAASNATLRQGIQALEAG